MVYLVLLCTLVKLGDFYAFLFESTSKHLQVRVASGCEDSSTCAEAHGWANPSIFTFGKFVSQMARFLSQLLRRVFAFHQCPLHARASQQFCTFCFHNLHRKGMKKRRSFLEKSSDVFLFFSDVFRKTSDFFGYSSHVFESSLLFASMALCEGCFFSLFSCRKTAISHYHVWRLWKQKSKNPRECARVSRAREKKRFFLSKIWCPTRNLDWHEIPLISSSTFAPF